MNIQGMQKLTLLDYPGKLACTIFTAPCNLRCPFCHNTSLIFGTNPQIPWVEVKGFLRQRVGLLEGVCITGGEPTIQNSLHSYLQEIKELGFFVKLDTNGTKPQVLQKLVEEGLVDYVALDVKNSPKNYAATVGVADYDLTPILESIAYLRTGVVDYEFRTTVVKEFHDQQSIRELAQMIQGADRYFLQNFQTGGDVFKQGLHGFSQEELDELLVIVKAFIPRAEIRGI